MGFSLSRALAGAVGGAAKAAGEIFDAQLKEEQVNRQREADLEKAKEVARFTDDLSAARERRADELKAARAREERSQLSTAVQDARAGLAEKGIKFGSPEGQFAVGEALLAAGYTEFGNKFFDNGSKMQDANNKHEEVKAKNEANRLYRQSQADAKAAETDKKGVDLYKSGMDAFTRIIRDAEGKETGKDTAVRNVIAEFTVGEVQKDPYGALRKAAIYGQRADQIRAANPKATEQQVAGALAHLAGGLVGEGDGEDLPGRHAVFADQPGEAVGQGAGLAGTGPGQDQQRPVAVLHRPALLGVERGQQVSHGGRSPGCGASARGCRPRRCRAGR